MHPYVSAIFYAQLATFFLLGIWRAARTASASELGNVPRPAHDFQHLIVAAVALVAGLVALIYLISLPIDIPELGPSGTWIIAFAALTIFIYIALVIGIRSSNIARGGQTSSAWSTGLFLLVEATALIVAMLIPNFVLPRTSVPQQYRGPLTLAFGMAVILSWHLVASKASRRKHRVESIASKASRRKRTRA
jgi:hypothetical protein